MLKLLLTSIKATVLCAVLTIAVSPQSVSAAQATINCPTMPATWTSSVKSVLQTAYPSINFEDPANKVVLYRGTTANNIWSVTYGTADQILQYSSGDALTQITGTTRYRVNFDDTTDVVSNAVTRTTTDTVSQVCAVTSNVTVNTGALPSVPSKYFPYFTDNVLFPVKSKLANGSEPQPCAWNADIMENDPACIEPPPPPEPLTQPELEETLIQFTALWIALGIGTYVIHTFRYH